MSVSTGDTENKKNLVASSDINVVVSGDDLSLTLTNNIKEQLTTSVVNSYSTEVDDVYNAPYVNNVVKDVYSTTETKTNKIWIDGKPVYRIVITGETNKGTNVETSVSYPGVDAIVNIGGFYYSSGSPSLKIAALGNTGAAAYDNGKLKYYFNNSGTAKYYYKIVFEYTKTTD